MHTYPKNIKYAKFYAPLVLVSLVVILESQFKNAVLARYPNADMQLATLALAISSFNLLNAFLSFVPQAVTVMAISRHSRRVCLRFVFMVGSILTVFQLLLVYSSPGNWILVRLLGIPVSILPEVFRYLKFLAPLVLINALRHYCTGLLIQSGSTRSVTILNILHLVVLVSVLLSGRMLMWSPVVAVAGATIASNGVHFFIISLLIYYKPAQYKVKDSDRPPLTYRGMLAFFWPMAITSGMFALSRPVLYAFVNRTDSALITVAALRLAFDLALFFQNPVNQFRHLYVVYGVEDPKGVRRFMLYVTLGLTGIMVLLAFTPLSRLLFVNVIGVEAGNPILQPSIQALRVLCLAPLTISIRNMYHGKMMVKRQTIGMAAGATLRVMLIGFSAWVLFLAGLLDHLTCATLLIGGFAMEAFTARAAVARIRRRHTHAKADNLA